MQEKREKESIGELRDINMYALKELNWNRLDCLQVETLSLSVFVIGILALGELKGKISRRYIYLFLAS